MRWYTRGLLSGLLLWGGACRLVAPEASLPTPPPPESLAFVPQDPVPAGERVVLLLDAAPVVDGQVVQVFVRGGYSMRTYTGIFESGQAAVRIPGEDLERSGEYQLTAQVGTRQALGMLAVLPLEPASPVTPYVGARSIVADGEQWSMTVVIPEDIYGNPVAADTPITVRAKHPDETVDTFELKTRYLLTWTRVHSSRTAGRTLIAARAQAGFGPEKSFLEVPGLPVPFLISVDPEILPADGRQLMAVETEKLHDRFGNLLPDGTIVTFVLTGPDGTLRTIPAQTIDGRAATSIQAPTEAGTYRLSGVSAGVEGLPVEVVFTPGPAVNQIEISIQPGVEPETFNLVAGPLLGDLDQFVPDGTLVKFKITGPNLFSQEVERPAEDGYAVYTLRLYALAPGRYQVGVSAGTGTGFVYFILQ